MVKKRDDIQCLRGIAIIYVVLFHISPQIFPNGYVGVDIFFIISGYLITMILNRSKPLSLSVILNYFSKRIRRIFPAYYIMVIIVVFLAHNFLIITDKTALIRDARFAFIFATNIEKWIDEGDYFALVNLKFLLNSEIFKFF